MYIFWPISLISSFCFPVYQSNFGCDTGNRKEMVQSTKLFSLFTNKISNKRLYKGQNIRNLCIFCFRFTLFFFTVFYHVLLSLPGRGTLLATSPRLFQMFFNIHLPLIFIFIGWNPNILRFRVHVKLKGQKNYLNSGVVNES